VFSYSLRRYRGQIIGWGLILSLLVLLIVGIYDSVAAQSDQLSSLVAGYPPELMAFFGMNDVESIFYSAEAFLAMEYFSFMPVVLGIYAVLMGSGLLASDEEEGKLDLILAHPISRTRLFWGRLLAFLVSILSILAIQWVAFMVSQNFSTLELGALELAWPFLSLAAVLFLFGKMALLLSMILPSRRMAAAASGVALVGSYFLTSLARIQESLEAFARFSPLNYYQGQEAFHDFDGGWWIGLMVVGVIFSLIAWWRFVRRDIRVGGEGGWDVGPLRRRFQRA
jgi:ABC-2 type transport system permease protein